MKQSAELIETVQECSTTGACPFSFTDASEQAQNYGCLPTPYQILEMKVHHGKTWACHSNPDQPCLGATKYFKEKGLIAKVTDKELLTENSDWHLYCTRYL